MFWHGIYQTPGKNSTCPFSSRVVLRNTFLFSYSYIQFGAYITDLLEWLKAVVHEYHWHKTSGQSKEILFLRQITSGLCKHGENKIKMIFSLNIWHVVKDCALTKKSQKMTLDFISCFFYFHSMILSILKSTQVLLKKSMRLEELWT